MSRPTASSAVGQIDQRRTALLERQSPAVAGAEQARQQPGDHRLVADDGHQRVGRLPGQRRDDLGDAAVSQRRLDHGLQASEGAGGDLGCGVGSRQRARQQHVGPVGDPGQAPRGHPEPRTAAWGQRSGVLGHTRRAARHGGGVTDDEQSHAAGSAGMLLTSRRR